MPARLPPSFSAGSCCLSAPEGRLGACAWALRGFRRITSNRRAFRLSGDRSAARKARQLQVERVRTQNRYPLLLNALWRPKQRPRAPSEKDLFHDQPDEVRQGPRRHLRHHLARRRAMPRRHHDPRGEARSRRTPRRHGRRHHRGRLSDRLRRRFRRRPRDRAARQEFGDLRALAGRVQGHRPLRRGDQAGQAQAHPHLPVHLAGAHEIQAAEGAARGLRDGDRAGDARAQPHRRRRVVGGGRHPHRARFPLPLRRSRDQGRRHHHQHPRHRRLHRAGGILQPASTWLRERVPNSEQAVFSVHCHNDLGMAVANSLAGVKRRRAADRMHHQRHRRAGRQRRARRGRDGDEDAQRRAAVLDRHRRHDADARQQARVGRDLVSGAVQQGDRRPERLRARVRHPPGRHAQAHPDLRDHDGRRTSA